MRRRRTEGDQREVLIAAARQVFARIEYPDVTVEDILKEAGCSRATFYGYFANKLEIFEEVVSLFRDELHSEVEQSSPIPRARIIDHDLLRSIVQDRVLQRIKHWRNEPALMRAMVMYQATAPAESVRARIRERAEPRRYREAIQHDRDSGLLHEGIDPALAALAIDSMVEWVCFSAFGRELISLDHLSDEQIAQNIADIWLHGVYNDNTPDGAASPAADATEIK